jgi:hypothetical protein
MSKDPFNASVQCAAIIAMIIAVISYFQITGWRLGASFSPDDAIAAIGLGIAITGHLVVIAVALWVLSHFFE